MDKMEFARSKTKVYFIDKNGNVFSNGNGEFQELRKGKNRFGYEKVQICKKEYKIHRIVAFAFLVNKENKPEVNHKNGIKDDNRVDNLEWCTRKENLKHAYSIGLKKVSNNNNFIVSPLWKGRFGKEHNRSKPVIQYNETGDKIGEYVSGKDAQDKTGINKCHICSCIKGRIAKAGGFIWRYL